jgi:hypothetical protein
MSAQVITIQETATQRLSPAIKLGCGNFWEEKYQEGGTEQQGVTAGLWVLRSGTPGAPASSHMRIHAGQRVEIPGFHLRVLEVKPGVEEQLGAVRIEVEPAAS